MSNSTFTQDPRIVCPVCGHKFSPKDAWELDEGSEKECPKCETELICTETDIVRWWYWSKKEEET